MTIGEKHYQPINANSFSGSRRKPVLQGCDKVSVIVHSLIIASILLLHLSSETGSLILGIIQLGEGVTKFTAGNIELKAICIVRILIVSSC